MQSSSENITSFCVHCESQLCVFHQYEEEVKAGLEMWLQDLQEKQGPTMHCDNSKKRKYCYRQYTLFINGGPLGAGIRRELPICILNKVRGLFPNEDGNPYMGFRHT